MKAHGKRSTYQAGCGCAACREAERAYRRRLRVRRRRPTVRVDPEVLCPGCREQVTP